MQRFELIDSVRVIASQASGKEGCMKHYAGLDVSLKETSICIVDETGSISCLIKEPSHPEGLA